MTEGGLGGRPSGGAVVGPRDKPGDDEIAPGMTELEPGMTELEPGITELGPGMTKGRGGRDGWVPLASPLRQCRDWSPGQARG